VVDTTFFNSQILDFKQTVTMIMQRMVHMAIRVAAS